MVIEWNYISECEDCSLGSGSVILILIATCEFESLMGRTGFPQTDMDEAMGRLRRGIERMADWLTESGGPWIMGQQISLVDLAIMPVIVRMGDILLSHVWDKHTEIQAWLDRLRQTPEFQATYYHGALLTEKYPHLARLHEEIRTAS